MHEKPTASCSMGFVYEAECLKGVVLEKKGENIQIAQVFENLQIPSTEEFGNVNPLDMEQIASFKMHSHQSLSVTALSAREVLVRLLEIKLTKKADVSAVFPFQVEPLLPYPLEKAVIDQMCLHKNEQGTLLSVSAARKDHLESHLEKFKKLDIEPEVVSSVPAALATFSQYCVNSEGLLLIVHLSWDEGCCVLVQRGMLLASYSLEVHLQEFLQAIMKDKKIAKEEALTFLREVDFSTLSKESAAEPSSEMSCLREKFFQFKQALERTLYALAKHAKGKVASEIVVTGDCGGLHHFSTALVQGLNKHLLTPINSSWSLSAKQLQSLAVCLGLALSSLPESQYQINFRQNDYAYPHLWKRYKKPVAAYLCLSALLTLMIFVFGQVLLGHREDLQKEAYGHLLATMNKSFESVEADYAKKHAQPQINLDIPELALKQLTHEELQERLNFLEKELQLTPEVYPLQPNIPRVSDVLAWLSTHANVAAPQGESGETQEAWHPLLQMESFSYTLVKRPEVTKKQEKYQVKVELEFSTPTPKLAREFHDALLAQNDFIDPKAEVKWSAGKGKYRASFFLKDKTVYPQTIVGGGKS